MISVVGDRGGPIDPFAPTRAGLYRDALVEVRALGPIRGRRSLHMVRTEHFDVTAVDGRICVGHAVPADRLDDDLAGLLADELFGPGWLRGSELFERIFTGVVRTFADDPLQAWEAFYRNTLARIDSCLARPAATAARGGTVADYAPVYGHAQSLLAAGSVLELGCCFGFLSLRLAKAGRATTASDVSPGAVRLLAAVAERLGVPLQTQVADAARFPASGPCADTVLAIHLLEHLDPAHGDRVVEEAIRLARRRVVIAVPLEEEADETWGHVRTVSMTDLLDWGRRSGRAHDVHEHHGGWLVIEADATARPTR